MLVIVTQNGVEELKDLDSVIASSLIKQGLAKSPEKKEEKLKVKITKREQNEKDN
jgi:hypothetical protein